MTRKPAAGSGSQIEKKRKESDIMKRKNSNTRYCVVCRTRSNGAGITSEDGVHICLDCAETVYRAMKFFHAEHLDHCNCGSCTGCTSDEFEF